MTGRSPLPNRARIPQQPRELASAAIDGGLVGAGRFEGDEALDRVNRGRDVFACVVEKRRHG